MRLHYFQHVPFEGLGVIDVWARHNQHEISGTRFYAGDTPPNMDEIDYLVVMGGPMGVNDHEQYPWLPRAAGAIRAAVEADKPVLGICLGAQLIAYSLGARVYKNDQPEIGWFPVTETEAARNSNWHGFLNGEMPVLHWHGDTFDLPDGAIHLARSVACENQAFVINERVVGLQFHLELGTQPLEHLLSACADELVEAPTIQSAEQMRRYAHCFDATNRAMHQLLDRLFV